MIIKNITTEQLNESVKELNSLYDNNIKLNDHEVINNKGTRHRVTLRVNDCRGEGSRHGFNTNKNGEYRRTNSACWHTHGDFFELLFKRNDRCEVRSGGNLITVNGGNWQNKRTGSMLNPIMFSDMCDC